MASPLLARDSPPRRLAQSGEVWRTEVRLAVPIAGRVLSKYASARTLRRRFRPRVVYSSAWTGFPVSFRHKLESRRSDITFQRRAESSCDYDALG